MMSVPGSGGNVRIIPDRDSVRRDGKNSRWIRLRHKGNEIILAPQRNFDRAFAGFLEAAERRTYVWLVDGESGLPGMPPMYFDYSLSSLSRAPARRRLKSDPEAMAEAEIGW